MKTFMKTTIVWFALIAVIFCTCQDVDVTDYDMTGTYTFSNGGGICTWIFSADGSYNFSGYGFWWTGNHILTGTWSSSGNNIAINGLMGLMSSDHDKEVFTVQKNGNDLTLTFKGKKEQISSLLYSFSISAINWDHSVTLTKSSNNDNNGENNNSGENTAVTFSGVTANGSASEPTTRLTLTFSQKIKGLSADDITLSGISDVTKGVLTGSGPTYTLYISFRDSSIGALTLSVEAAKTGYTISDSPQTVTVYYVIRQIEMVSINPGKFYMGSPTGEFYRNSNETIHEVTMARGFSMSKYEVTQAQWIDVMGQGGDWTRYGSNYPISGISWYDVIVFCNKLSMKENLYPVYHINYNFDPSFWYNNSLPLDKVEMEFHNGYRLPTEAEWEYACRAGNGMQFNTGINITTDQANYDGYSPYNFNERGVYRAKKTPVGSFAPNAWGLYDMHGNVDEWCWDWYGDYSNNKQEDPTGPVTGTERVLRGGSYADTGANLRSAYRWKLPPASEYGGFRLVRNW